MSTPDETTGAPVQGAPAPGPALGRAGASHVYLVGRVLEELAKALYTYGDAHLTSTTANGALLLPVEDRESAYIGPHRIGRVQMYAPKKTASLKPDHPALIAWAKEREHYRHNVLTIEILAPAVVAALKAHAVKVGAAVDKYGEPVPGLTVSEGDPTPTKSLDKDFMAELLAPERIEQLAMDIIAGAVALPGLTPSIEKGEQA
ncbi:hypothetical protein ACQP10_38125 (plasmid) [Streptosporangium sandarakinum]|uniref:hypothetical protein n=1 Tax=Streptosporangium sandarakinum TaxID=1260955 RepID=UPI003D9007A7